MDRLVRELPDLLIDWLKLLAFVAVVVSPAVWACLRLGSNLSVVARLALGVTLGFALFVVVAWYAAIHSFGAVAVAWLVVCAAAFWLGLRRAGGAPDATGQGDAGDAALREPPAASSTFASVCLAAALVAGFAVQLVALSRSELPQGLDPSFHCVVGQRLLDARQATGSLWPLEDHRLNYPIGSHLWVALAAHWTGLEIHEVFRHSFALAICGTGLVAAAAAERLFGSRWAAAAAAFAFVFGSYRASLGAYVWGGLPSALAMWQALAALLAATSVRGAIGVVMSMLLVAGTSLTSHHAMVAFFGGAVLTAAAGHLFLPEHRVVWRRLALGLGGGAVVAAVYWLPLIGRVGELSRTGVVGYHEDFHWPWTQLWDWGPGFVVTVLAGMLGRARTGCRSLRFALLVLAASWLAAFCVLDYGGRIVTQWLYGKVSTPFTPSRFLFEAQFALAVFAGGGLVRLWEWLGRRQWGRWTLPAVASLGLETASLTLVGGGTAAWAVWRIVPLWEPVAADGLLPLGKWVHEHLPADAFVLDRLPNGWTTYACRRESTYLFIPISEPRSARLQMKLPLIPVKASVVNWRAIGERLGKPIYVVSVAEDRSWQREPLHVAGPVAVFGPISEHAGRAQ